MSGNIRKKWDVLIETTKNILRKEAPDIVLINGTYSAPWILAQAAQELGIPMVLRYAGVLQKEVGNKGYFVRRRLLTYEQSIVSAANAIIFPSTLCRKVVEHEIVHRSVKKGIVIPNPVSHVGTVHQKHSRKARFTMAAIGRWSAIKNFQAFLALHDALQEEQWPHRAIMVTSFWDERFGISETIERKDPMNQEDLQTFYQSLDLLVVPSHFETFCNVAAEALVHGCSVLVSENIGIADVLRKAGLDRMVIKSFADPAVVVAAVKRLSKTKLSTKEHKLIVKLLDPQEIHEGIVRVLNQVLEGDSLA
ncbi:MAG: glycosyltransferase [Patescibacteria group bacterium]